VPASPHEVKAQGGPWGSSDTTPALQARQSPLPCTPALLLLLAAVAVKPVCLQGSWLCCLDARCEDHLDMAACAWGQ
jgi:hypothetical protein